MDKKLRIPLLALLFGIGVLIALQAPGLALIPYTTGIVLLINKQLLINEWIRYELNGSTILRTVNEWLDFELDQVMIGAIVLSVAQVVFPVLALNPELRFDQQAAYASVYYGLLVIELTIIFLIPIGHLVLRLQRLTQNGRVAFFAIGGLIASTLCLFNWTTPLIFSGPVFVFGLSILFLGFNTEGPANINETLYLSIVSITVVALGLTATGYVAVALTVVILSAAASATGFGGFLWFRNRLLGQEKIEIR